MNNIEILEDLRKSLEEILKEPFAKDEMYNGNLYEYERGYELDLEEIKVVLNIINENKKMKDTNKKLYELCQGKAMQEFINNDFDFIPKSKVKEIIYPTPENPISFEVQSSEMYKKLEKLVEGE